MKAVLLAVVLSTAATLASAQNVITGHDFLRAAQSLERINNGQGASVTDNEQTTIFVMLGIVQGVRETMDVLVSIADSEGLSKKSLACIPTAVSTGQLVLVLKADIEKAPSLLHHRFSLFAQNILQRTYPCR